MKLENFQFDVAIIGGGAIGISIAKLEAESGKSVVVLEKENCLGSETSSRNSEVVHAGIYYKTNSLKHKLCITGRKTLYEYLNLKNIPYRKCGKIIFSNKIAEHNDLENIRISAEENGLDLKYCSNKQLKPSRNICNISKALWSPETGIFDSHKYVQSLQEDVLNASGMVCLNTNVRKVNLDYDLVELNCITGTDEFIVSADRVYNAAGLHSLNLAKQNNLGDHSKSTNYFVKGHYFSYRKKVYLPNLLYPIPSKLGLGVHLTFDMSGEIRFGPDTMPLGEIYNYKSEVSDQSFFEKVRENFLGISLQELSPAYAGIRPKIKREGKILTDFSIEKISTHKLVNLLGIESPGLTSSLAIAEYAITMMRGR